MTEQSAGELLREARAAFVVMLRAENVLSDISKWSVKQHWSGPENGFSDDATQRRWLDFNKGWIAARAHLSQASERADGVMVPPVDPERANRVTKWIPTTDLKLLRRLGKTTEECGELLAVLARCVIQGIDEIDPSSGKCNRQRLVEELADVQAQINCTVESIGLDRVYIATRVTRKEGYMREWEGMFGDSAAPAASVSADARDALRLLLAEVVAAGLSDAKDYGWPIAVKAACDALGVTMRFNGLKVVLIDKDAAMEKK